MTFCNKLQVLRKNKGLTQEELAEKLNVSRAAVAKWESGQSYPDISNQIFLLRYHMYSVIETLKHLQY